MPDHPLTLRGLAEHERDTGIQAGLRHAVLLAPDLPLVHLALAAFDKNRTSAGFLRRFDLQRLPADAATRLQAIQMLRDQDQSQTALQLAWQVHDADPGNPAALRQVAAILKWDLNRPVEALQAWELLVARSDANADDLSNAGLLCIEQKLVPRGRELLQEAAARFPDDPSVYRLQGWGFIVLGSSAEALAAFEKSAALTHTSGQQPAPGLFAGLAASRWLTGDKAGAVAAYQQLIPAQAEYADKRWVGNLHWTGAEKVPLLAALAETLRQHPELAPKPATSP